MDAKELMNMVRRSALDFVSYDRANLKEDAFYGTQGKTKYYSVVHFVENYHSNFENGDDYEVYLIFNENEVMHFTDKNEAVKYTEFNFHEKFPKDVYTITHADREQFYRRDKNLKILLD